jgi:hypothetical protein
MFLHDLQYISINRDKMYGKLLGINPKELRRFFIRTVRIA